MVVASDMTPLEVSNIITPRLEHWKSRFQLPRIHRLLLACYLHPLYLIRNFKVTQEFLEDVLESLEDTMNHKRIAPGELVGTIAAQSIGEPSTQMTLNSFTFDTPIIVREQATKKVHIWSIGEFVKECERTSIKKEYYSETDTTWAEIEDTQYEVQSVNEDGNVSWKAIEAGTRHPVVNEDGSNTMIRVNTSDC
jgi:hypothetical protein